MLLLSLALVIHFLQLMHKMGHGVLFQVVEVALRVGRFGNHDGGNLLKSAAAA